MAERNTPVREGEPAQGTRGQGLGDHVSAGVHGGRPPQAQETASDISVIHHTTHSPATKNRREMRGDIQALRAIAVLGVILFHINPAKLTGGFLGVDVFFVISGYLITSHLFTSIERGTFTFAGFYARRARRLLPAAGLVIATSMLVGLLVFPFTEWRGMAMEALAATFYVQNWWLISSSSDYFTSLSLFQHYWSLSVEEQFYLVWPLLMFGVAAAVPRRKRAAALAVMGVVIVASLVVSVWQTTADPGQAYLSTLTRVWQFGLGGAAALLPVALVRQGMAKSIQTILVIGAFAILGVSLLIYTEEMPVPGWITLLPLLAVAFLLYLGTSGAHGVLDKVLGVRPVQYIGDISYSMYLWHWPLVVFARDHVDGKLPFVWQMGVFAATLGLAALTKTFVEDPFRRPWKVQSPLSKSMMVGLLAVCLSAPLGLMGYVLSVNSAAKDSFDNAKPECRGAMALNAKDCVTTDSGALYPDPLSAFASFDNTKYRQECFPDIKEEGLSRCTYGSDSAPTHIAVIGDSHALMWLPAFEPAMDRGDVRITVMLRASCPVNDARIIGRAKQVDDLCNAWSNEVVDAVIADSDSFDAIVTSALTNKRFQDSKGKESKKAAAAGFASVWQRLAESGTPVAVLGEVPRLSSNPIDCLALGQDFDKCGVSVDKGLKTLMQRVDDKEPVLVYAVNQTAQPDKAKVSYVPVKDWLCTDTVCSAAIGGTIVYVDHLSHLSPAYARTLAPLFEQGITEATGVQWGKNS